MKPASRDPLPLETPMQLDREFDDQCTGLLPRIDLEDIDLFPLLVDDPLRVQEFKEQIRLIQIFNHSAAIPVLEADTQSMPPRAIRRRIQSSHLSNFTDLEPDQRIALFSKLVLMVDEATQLGLIHGALAPSRIGVQKLDPFCPVVDYLDRFQTDSKPRRTEPNTDFMAVAEISRNLISPLLDHDRDGFRFHGIMLGKFRTIFRRVAESDFTELDFRHLVQLAQELHPQLDKDKTDEFQCLVDVSADGEEDPNDLTAVVTSDPQTEVDHQSQTDDVGPISDLRENDLIGRFRIEKKIGEGGMGAVFRGTDVVTGESVAVKILRTGTANMGQAIRRFKKEARLLGQVRNEFVTRLIDSNEFNGIHYLVMEYVEGTDLKRFLNANKKLTEPQALGLVQDIARGLVDAHLREIVHRDLKPENIMLAGGSSSIPPIESTPSQLQVKLTDFGIARHINQTESLEMTRAGTILGTPKYMAPEQCKGTGRITPAADIYSLGIILFELLTGRVPFEADEPMALAAKHCFDEVPDVRRFSQNVSDLTATLITRMLVKNPHQRLADAGQLAREIERILQGDAEDIANHPHLPKSNKGKIWERSFHWKLANDSEDLWPFVSDTDRLNRAIGLSAAQFQDVIDENQQRYKAGEISLFGTRLRWKENPFEWIEGSRMSVLREFENGPFEWFKSTVTLTPQPGGGTLLTHTLAVLPRHVWGRMLAQLQLGWKSPKALEKVYRRIDETAQSTSTPSGTDPFESSLPIPRSVQRRIESLFEELISAGVAPHVASKLESFYRNAAPQPLAHIRPYVLAEQLGLPPAETLDACLQAAHLGLLEISWDIICPTCKVPSSSTPLLEEVEMHTHCQACDVEFQSNIDTAIELVFKANSDFRTVDESTYCIGGPQNSPHILGQFRLAPRERLTTTIALGEGEYLLRSSGLSAQKKIRCQASARGALLIQRLSQLTDQQNKETFRTGRLELDLSNDSDEEQLVRFERISNRDDAVTAAVLTSHRLFRRLFPSQNFRDNLPIHSKPLTLVDILLDDLDHQHATRSDTDVYQMVNQHQNQLIQLIESNSGSVLKTRDDGLLASFPDNCAAVETTFQLVNASKQQKISQRIAVHRGRTLVATQNGRADHFGVTTRTVQQLNRQIPAAWILSDCVYNDPDIQELLEEFPSYVDEFPMHSDQKILARISKERSNHETC